MSTTDDQNTQIDNLFREMHDSLYAYAAAALKNSALAEEAVQDAFVIACCKPEALLSSPNPRGWLVKTLKYSIFAIRKSQSQMSLLLLSLQTGSRRQATVSASEAGYIDLLSLCQNCLNDDFELFMRVARDQCSMLEAAEEFGLSVEACKKRVQRARKKIQNFLDEL